VSEGGRGPAAVWRDYDQRALDAQYDQKTLVRDTAPYEREWRRASEAARQALRPRADLAYGDGARRRLDLFLPDGDGPFPLVAFFHGGGWVRREKDLFAFPAPAFVGEGVAFAAVDFDLVPAVTVAGQAEQAREAVLWLQANAAALGLDADAVFAAGHSSGAHLAASLITGDAGTPPADVKGALLVSGIYDLEPVRLSARNELLGLDADQARALSPAARIPPAPCPVVVAWGGAELDEFQRQSADLADAWEAAGGEARRVHLPADNHFSITRQLSDPTSEPMTAFLEVIDSWR